MKNYDREQLFLDFQGVFFGQPPCIYVTGLDNVF